VKSIIYFLSSQRTSTTPTSIEIKSLRVTWGNMERCWSLWAAVFSVVQRKRSVAEQGSLGIFNKPATHELDLSGTVSEPWKVVYLYM
jgi:hypothetical protein